MVNPIRTIDLFCGCGGLSLGFELYSGSLQYQVLLALDNDAAALGCYNNNSPSHNGMVPTGRLCDLTWFTHKSEVLLYYLAHLALWQPDEDLLEALRSSDMNFPGFLARLHQIDSEFIQKSAQMVASPSYQEALGKVDGQIFTLEICKTFLNKISLSSLRSSTLTPTSIPWQEEYAHRGFALPDRAEPIPYAVSDVLESSLRLYWDMELAKLEEASLKEGRGQHKVVAARLRSLMVFLRGPAGESLKENWIEWRARRDSARASYCIGIEEKLPELYSSRHRVHLLLGGPPCKGFSRIGRAVIESLREQGVHAWTSKEYGDERNALLHKYVLFLEALRPDVFLFENVAHFQSGLKTPSGKLEADIILSQAIEDLSLTDLHYDVQSAIVKARQHAIPQDRERFILVGFNGATTGEGASKAFFNLPMYNEAVPLQAALNGLEAPGEFIPQSPLSNKTDYKTKTYTLVDRAMPQSHIRYVEWIRQPAPDKESAPDFTDAHIVRALRPDDLAFIEKFAPGQRWMDYKLKKSRTLSDLRLALEQVLQYIQAHPDEKGLPSGDTISNLLERTNKGLLLRLVLEEANLPPEFEGEHHLLSHDYLEKGDDRHGDWFERLSADQPCKTIVAHIGKDTYGYIHPYLNRALSIREAARVQSFPDFFSFVDIGVVNAYAMIGNAVPPLLANLFADQLATIHLKVGIFGLPERKLDAARRPAKVSQLSMTLF